MQTHRTRLATGPPDRAVFDTRPEAAAKARNLTRAFVGSLSPAVDEQTTMSVTLVVSELVTNAVRHARGASCSLRLQARPDSVVVTVSDADPRPPRQRTPDLTGGTGGFGWPMVHSLAKSVTITTRPTGKTIRAELPR
ncbi:ATP-binding protein [Streptomyces albus]|uniref:ATP-binding protein n=1 Tax=Streptomyces sp. PHES57 TaxID=2872626 RepID=UPI001CED02AC|nr:ATP-binding protein [Streptomyces sp. PHES57]